MKRQNLLQRRQEVENIDKKYILTILFVIAASAMLGNIALTYATNSTNNNLTTSTLAECGPGFGKRGVMLGGGMGPMMHGFGQNIEVSSEYNATVMTIIQSDTDVQNLLSQGYSVSAVRPVIKTVVQGDGTVVMKASSAVVEMDNGATSKATVWVDVDAGKVTKIVTLTMTVIEK